jgi:hypothetical protein
VGSILDQADRRYLRHLKDAFPTLEGLFTAGAEVADLIDQPGWNHLMTVLDREVATIDRRLDMADQPHSQAQYALEHGRRDGLRSAREAAQAIVLAYLAKLEEQRRRHEGGAESPPEGG